LLQKIVDDETEDLFDVPDLLWETYAIGSGWDIREPIKFVNGLEKVLRNMVGVSEDAAFEQEKDDEPSADEKETEDDGASSDEDEGASGKTDEPAWNKEEWEKENQELNDAFGTDDMVDDPIEHDEF
jgi:hypothetical protein